MLQSGFSFGHACVFLKTSLAELFRERSGHGRMIEAAEDEASRLVERPIQ